MDVAVLVVSSLVAVSVFLMWDLTREQSCRYCEHCRRKQDEAKERQKREAHDHFHRYRMERADDCSDADCPGRRH